MVAISWAKSRVSHFPSVCGSQSPMGFWDRGIENRFVVQMSGPQTNVIDVPAFIPREAIERESTNSKNLCGCALILLCFRFQAST
jgi:hypothetical protein